MPFKKDEHGNYVEQDGLLVFVGPDGAEPVSYTHLTLPTICSV